MTIAESPEPAVGLVAFDSLRAEDEPWLDRCFVPPPDFDLIAGARSSLVFGTVGSGKTALFKTLLDRLTSSPGQSKPPSRLVVQWHPASLKPGLTESAAAATQLAHILSGCADALLAHLAHWPQGFVAAPEDVQRTLVWFIHHYLTADMKQRIITHAAQAQESGRDLLHSILSRESLNEWLALAKPVTVISELTKALGEIGLGVVNILLSPDTLDDSESTVNVLRAFLSSLTLFENRHFVYKMILPAKFRTPLALAGGVPRRRIDLYPLSWSVDDLAEIVTKRIAIAAEEPVTELTEICQDSKLVRWLERTGGDSPRGWLKVITPLVAQYLRRQRPLSMQEWKTIRKKSPPPLIFDEEEQSVTVGWRRIDDLPEVPLALLRYLYHHRNQTCTRDELFFDAYLPASYPETSPEDRHEYPKEYAGLLDTAIWRLREKIEPDPRSPIYVITRRGKGYKLEHAW